MDANNWRIKDQDCMARFWRDAGARLNLRPMLKLSSLSATERIPFWASFLQAALIVHTVVHFQAR